MTREDFCKQLQLAKLNSGLKGIEICTRTQFMPHQVKRIERGLTNFGMNKCMKLIIALNCVICITSGKAEIIISDYNDLAKFLQHKRVELNIPVAALARQVGIGHSVIQSFEAQRNAVSIDTLLKVLPNLGCTMSIKSK